MNPRRFRTKPKREQTPLEYLRSSAGFTSREKMAQGNGLTVLGIYKTEMGLTDPRLSTAMKMAKAVKVSLDTFYAAWAKGYDDASERIKDEQHGEHEHEHLGADEDVVLAEDEPEGEPVAPF